MRQHYKVFLTLIFIVTFMITSGLLLFGTYDATQIGTPDCEEQIRSDCFPRGERPTCRNMDSTPRCPVDAAKSGDNTLDGGEQNE